MIVVIVIIFVSCIWYIIAYACHKFWFLRWCKEIKREIKAIEKFARLSRTSFFTFFRYTETI